MKNNAETQTDAGAAGLRNIAVSELPSDPGRAVAPVGAMNESAALISMIERAARDPSVDPDKMERFFALKERADAEHARRSYDSAFAQMQEELPEVCKSGKIIIRDKNNKEIIIQSTPYALWDDTNRTIKPILAKYGFGLSFRITQSDSRLTATAVLSHRDGHRETTEFSAPIDNTGSKNNVQGWGSSFSYGKRYAATALLNITTRGEDDDGNAAGKLAEHETFTTEAVKAKIKEAHASEAWFCEHYSVETFDDLTNAQRSEIISGLNTRIRAMKKGAKK